MEIEYIRISNCPKCNAKRNYINFTEDLIYIWCVKCPYQAFEAKILYIGKVMELKDERKLEK